MTISTTLLLISRCETGQGVYTITNREELQDFMKMDHHYDKFIVQSLVGNASWSSTTRAGRFYHVGTIPNKKNQTFVSDLRMMVVGNGEGFQPVACYARRARKPLLKHLEDDLESMFFFENRGRAYLTVKLQPHRGKC